MDSGLKLKRQPKPKWIKMRPPSGDNYLKIKALLKDLNIATVCQEAICPNLSECWGGGTATFMIMGDTCTRGCRFCSVKTSKNPLPLDPKEPEKVVEALKAMNLKYVVLTSVDRDDLQDGGAYHFARTVKLIHEQIPDLLVEVLTPDFLGRIHNVDTMIHSKPDVFAQNVETVKRLTHKVRDPRAGYEQTLNVLKYVKEQAPKRLTKTSIMLGLGETDEEVLETLEDLREINCDVVTFGQYLQPTKKQLRVEKFYTPEEFLNWKKVAEDIGFFYVASGPMVRSSYKAAEFYMAGQIKKMRELEQNATIGGANVNS